MRNLLLNVQIALDALLRLAMMLVAATLQLALLWIALCLIGGAIFLAFWFPKMFFTLLPFAALLIGAAIYFLNKQHEKRIAASLKRVEETFARAKAETGTANRQTPNAQTPAPAGARGDDRSC